MQIRELSLKELYEAHELLKELYKDLDYELFEERVYEMRERYTMIGVFERGELMAFAGVDVLTTLKLGRHVRVYDFVAKEPKSERELRSYLEDYARIAAAEEVVYEC